VLGSTGITAIKASRLAIRSGAWLAKKGITRLGAAIGTAKRANENRKAKEAIRDMAILKDVSGRLVTDLEADLPNKQVSDEMLLDLSDEDRTNIENIRAGDIEGIEGLAEDLQERSDDELYDMRESFIDAKANIILNRLPKVEPPYTLDDVKFALENVEEVKTVGEDGEEHVEYESNADLLMSVEDLQKAGLNENFFAQYNKITSMSKEDAGKLYQRINVQDSGKLEVLSTDEPDLTVDEDLIKTVSGLRFAKGDKASVEKANEEIKTQNTAHKQTEAMQIETNASIDIMLAKNLRTYVKELDFYIDRYETQRLTNIPTEIKKAELKNLKNLRKIAAEKVKMLEDKGIIEVTNEGKEKSSKLTEKAKEVLLDRDNINEFEEHGKKQMREARLHGMYDENTNKRTDGTGR
jgi:predicted transcriptional regulator